MIAANAPRRWMARARLALIDDDPYRQRVAAGHACDGAIAGIISCGAPTVDRASGCNTTRRLVM
jgi:hypothetical protein